MVSSRMNVLISKSDRHWKLFHVIWWTANDESEEEEILSDDPETDPDFDENEDEEDLCRSEKNQKEKRDKLDDFFDEEAGESGGDDPMDDDNEALKDDTNLTGRISIKTVVSKVNRSIISLKRLGFLNLFSLVVVSRRLCCPRIRSRSFRRRWATFRSVHRPI